MFNRSSSLVAVPALLAALLFASLATAQERAMVFGIRPNSVTPQAGYLGWEVGSNLFLTLGLQFLSAGAEVKETHEGEYYESHASDDASATLWVPSIGLKYFLTPQQVNGVNPYLAGTLFSLIPSVEGDDEIEQFVDDFWSAGLSAAFGCEYFFHRQFSIGGEFGVNLFYGSWDHAGVEGTTDIEATYTALTLNFLL